jgi:molybdate transport system substrate-binding protein
MPTLLKLLCCFWIPLLVMSIAAAVDAYARERILLFGAISTTNAVTAIAKDFAERDICPLSPVFAASSTLARQIEFGAPADIFLSANENWMDWLDEKGKLERGSRVGLLGNRLVMIVPTDAIEHLVLNGNLIAELGDSRFVVADPDHVPAGIYAKAALENLGLWQTLSPRLARMQNVRTALAVVEHRGAAAAIVYASDAAASKRVRVAEVVDANRHPPIRYPLAIIKGRATEAVLACYEHLLSPASAVIFESHGFSAQ